MQVPSPLDFKLLRRALRSAFYANILQSEKIRTVLDGHIADRRELACVDDAFFLQGMGHFECLSTVGDLSIEIIVAAVFLQSPHDTPILSRRDAYPGEMRFDVAAPGLLQLVEPLLPDLITRLSNDFSSLSLDDTFSQHNNHTIIQLLLAFANAGLYCGRDHLITCGPLLRDIVSRLRSRCEDSSSPWLDTVAHDANAVLEKLGLE